MTSRAFGFPDHHSRPDMYNARVRPSAFPVILVLAVIALGAQGPFRSAIDLVSLGVTVIDRKGRLVVDLNADDFDVFEDGKPQTVQYFSRGGETDRNYPLHVGLLFDTSGSMIEDIRMSRTAAVKFLNALPSAEDMTLVEFDTEVRIGRFSQNDFARLVERIRARKPDGFTALYDALGAYLADAAQRDGRKVLVLYTDGGDTRSSLSWGEALDLLKASDVTIYPVGFLEHQSPSLRLGQQRQLQEIAQVTGGQAFFPRTGKDIDIAYERVLAELRAQYSLGYVSTNASTDGAWRKISIKLNRSELKNARIRTRAGYFGPYRPH